MMSEVTNMAFVKADLEKEREELNKLVSENEEARRAYEEFQARIALQQQLVEMRKAEHMTQSDVATAAGIISTLATGFNPAITKPQLNPPAPENKSIKL